MISVIKIILIILLYLMIGYRIFMAAEKGLGGKEAYLEIIGEHTSDPRFAYTVAVICIVLFWPYFVLEAIIRRNK